jgi:hypothetical protein
MRATRAGPGVQGNDEGHRGGIEVATRHRVTEEAVGLEPDEREQAWSGAGGEQA